MLGYDFITAPDYPPPGSRWTINLLKASARTTDTSVVFSTGRSSILSIPCVVLPLLVTTLKLNIGSIVGLFLIVAALKSIYVPFNRLIESLVRYERTYFIVMGVVHGLTNLGGLLTAIIHSKQYYKDQDPRHDRPVLTARSRCF